MSLECPLPSYCFLCRSEIQDGRHRKHRLTFMGCSNAFFSETTNMIKAKLTWMFIGWSSIKVFCSDMKFKMAAMAGLSLTLDPMGKMFQNASSLKPLWNQTAQEFIGSSTKVRFYCVYMCLLYNRHLPISVFHEVNDMYLPFTPGWKSNKRYYIGSIGGLMVSVLTSSAVDPGFEPYDLIKPKTSFLFRYEIQNGG